MLVIYGNDFLIEISDYEEYCIYHTDYECDKYGNVVNASGRTDTYDMGDIIIQTPFCKYILKKIYFSFFYCEKLVKYISKKKKKGEKFIVVDLKKIASEDVANCEVEIEFCEEKILKPEKFFDKEEKIRNISFASGNASSGKGKLLDEILGIMDKNTDYET